MRHPVLFGHHGVRFFARIRKETVWGTGQVVWGVNGYVPDYHGSRYAARGYFLTRREARENAGLMFRTERIRGLDRNPPLFTDGYDYGPPPPPPIPIPEFKYYHQSLASLASCYGCGKIGDSRDGPTLHTFGVTEPNGKHYTATYCWPCANKAIRGDFYRARLKREKALNEAKRMAITRPFYALSPDCFRHKNPHWLKAIMHIAFHRLAA